MNTEQTETTANLKLILHSSIIVFVSVVLAKIFNYGYKIFIARNFGVDVYGLFSLALVIVGVFSSVFALGLADGLIRYIPIFRGKNQLYRAQPLVKRTLLVLSATSILSVVFLAALSETISVSIFSDPRLIPYILILSFSLPFVIIGGIFTTLIRAFENIVSYTFLNNVYQNGIKLLILLIFVFVGFNFYPVPISYVITYFCFFLGTFLFSRRYLKEILHARTRKGNSSDFRQFLSYSWPFIFTSLLFSLFYSTDSLVLGYYVGASEVGIYNAAITIGSLFFIAPDLFMQLFHPLASKLSARRGNLVQHLTKQVSKWIYMINLPLFILIFLYPGVFINVMFGSEYLAAENSLRILSVGGIFSSFLSLLTGLVSIKGKSKLVLTDFVFLTIINFVLDVVFVSSFGLEGAALSTTISWILFTIILTAQVKKVYGFLPWMRSVVPITLVSTIPVCLVYAIRQFVHPTLINLISITFLFILVYVFLLFLFRCLNKNDLILIDAIRYRFTHSKKRSLI